MLPLVKHACACVESIERLFVSILQIDGPLMQQHDAPTGHVLHIMNTAVVTAHAFITRMLQMRGWYVDPVSIMTPPCQQHWRRGQPFVESLTMHGHTTRGVPFTVMYCSPAVQSFNAEVARDLAAAAKKSGGDGSLASQTLIVVIPPKPTSNALALLAHMCGHLEVFTFVDCAACTMDNVHAPSNIHVLDAAACAAAQPHVPVQHYRRMRHTDAVARYAGAKVGDVVGYTTHTHVGAMDEMRLVVHAANTGTMVS